MRTALIENGTVTNVILAGDTYTPPKNVTMVASETAQIGDAYDGTTFTSPAPPAPTAAQQGSALKERAQVALDASDMVATRCFKAGVAFPTDWQTYVSDLRAIVSSGTGTLPTAPAYPAGT
jgi:hypothetical protein